MEAAQGGGGVHPSILSATEHLERIKNDESNDERKILRFSGAWNVTRHGVQHFVDFLQGDSHHVKTLVIQNFSLAQPSDGGLDILRDFLVNDANLTRVVLVDCDFGTEEDAARLLQAFRTNKSVTDLKIYGIVNLKDAALGACLSGILQHNARLQKLDCAGLRLRNAIQSFQPGLGSNGSLKELYLRSCGLGDAGIHLIADSLVGNTTLEILDISWNEISANFLDDITRLLEHTQLKKIMVGGNHYRYTLGNKNAVDRFIRVLKQNTILEEFSGFYPDLISTIKRAAIEKVLARNQFMKKAVSLLALQPGGRPIASKSGVWYKAIAKLVECRDNDSDNTGPHNAIFKILCTRPTIFEKQVVVRRPTAAATSTHPHNEPSQRRGHHDAAEKDGNDEEDAPVGLGRKRQRLS